MEELNAKEVIDALTAWLGKDARVDLRREAPDSRLVGWIVYPGFKDLSRATRQEWLWNGFAEEGTLPRWKGLRGTFRERASQIGAFFTFSPYEYEQAFAEAA